MLKFEHDNSEIARYWLEPGHLETLDTNNEALIYESWDDAAKRIMARVWRAP